MSTTSKQSGYTLLFAVLISVLILGVAVFMSGIARKEYILSSTALDSMYSFYAADSGIECVMYNIAAISSSTLPAATFSCNDKSVKQGDWGTVNASSHGITNNFGPVNESVFPLGFGPSANPWGCAYVTIDVYQDDSGNNNGIITSRGYNLCNPNVFTPDTSSPRTVERALQTTVVL